MASQRVSPTRQSTYAPLRYESTRPYARTLAERYALRYKGDFAKRHAYVTNELVPALQKGLGSLGPIRGLSQIHAEIGNIQTFGEFLRGGRIIYDLNKNLSTALVATDVDSIPLSAISRPADAIYLHFGKHDDTDGIEGAFVAWHEVPGEPPRMTVDFAMNEQFRNQWFWASAAGEVLPTASIDISDPKQGIVEALEQSIESNRVEFERVVEDHRIKEEALKKEGVEPLGTIGNAPSLVNLPLLKKGITLVVNALLYLGAVPDDILERWDDRAPSELVFKAENGEKEGTRRTAMRTLSNQDYLRVRLIGQRFSESLSSDWHDETGRKVVTHFRRGHFRNQPYGPERSLRKIVFIPPVVVNAGQGDPLGRIYES